MDYVLRPEPLADLLQSVSDMAALFEQLPLSPKHEGWFRRRAWVRTIHGTTHIEGNTLNDDEVEEVLLSGPEDFSRRDALEVLNTRAATRFADAIADDHDLPIGEAFVREVHRRVLQDLNPLHRPGEYRRGENRVTDGRGRLIFSTPISGDVPDLMQQFGAWLSGESDSEPGPVAAALAHLELVGVHPFYDGNGRTARVLGRTLFRRHDYKFRSIVSLDAQLDTDRERYFEAIRSSMGRTYRRHYDATSFVTYFLQATLASCQYTLDRIGLFHRVVDGLHVEVAAGRIPGAAIEPLAYVWVNRTIRPSQYTEMTGRSKQLTTYELGKLAGAHYLEPSGATRKRRYVIGPAFLELGERVKLLPLPAPEPNLFS